MSGYADGCNRGTNVIQITSHLLIEFKANAQEELFACYCKSVQEPKIRVLMGPREEPTVIVMLNRHSIKPSAFRC